MNPSTSKDLRAQQSGNPFNTLAQSNHGLSWSVPQDTSIGVRPREVWKEVPVPRPAAPPARSSGTLDPPLPQEMPAEPFVQDYSPAPTPSSRSVSMEPEIGPYRNLRPRHAASVGPSTSSNNAPRATSSSTSKTVKIARHREELLPGLKPYTRADIAKLTHLILDKQVIRVMNGVQLATQLDVWEDRFPFDPVLRERPSHAQARQRLVMNAIDKYGKLVKEAAT
ncbi:hypothetical protein CYLTODRAFT_422862 [Cylindrobasidium torrendii FP15055 ss-10]|uniref:Uncharacterized protein n=1 Tax=Cylindrobasidium torrendii FP15055 ss-10 TaxID=1314674 RepID=A0A0D7B9A2_9AGAR|nr:hypothetical protein CYLTODRAFT_422862 [Cylindrobasidium torrendii FP15055 ss-10]